MLSLPIFDSKNKINLDDCIKNFSHEELIDGDNMIHCSECHKKTKSIKTMYIWELPETLIIHFKRFNMNNEQPVHTYTNMYKYMDTSHGISKITTVIDFPLSNLTLDQAQFSWHKSDCSYDLYAVNEHRGGYSGGHYISYCRNPVNNLWYIYDDDDVTHIPNNQIENKLITSNAYILFYSKNYLNRSDKLDIK